LTTDKALSVNMRTAILLLEFFVVAIVLVFLVTASKGAFRTQALSVALILQTVALSLLHRLLQGEEGVSCEGGASVLGVFGVALRVVVSPQPKL